MFKGKFRAGLLELYQQGQLGCHGSIESLAQPKGFHELVSGACAEQWVVYSKKPFAGPQAVLAYLSRYTHRVAIGNGRLLALNPSAGTVTFSYKDYADQSRRKTMELSLPEFLRRFCLHILPARFVKIRHYGLLGNRQRKEKIAAARAQLGDESRWRSPLASPSEPLATLPPMVCPRCGSGRLLFIERRRPYEVLPPLPPIDSS